jgi:hypothetical protein
MKLTAEIVAKQRKEIQKMILDNEKRVLTEIKQNYPQLVKAMRKEWDMSNSEFLDADLYEGIESIIPEDTR